MASPLGQWVNSCGQWVRGHTMAATACVLYGGRATLADRKMVDNGSGWRSAITALARTRQAAGLQVCPGRLMTAGMVLREWFNITQCLKFGFSA
jgi:hypothetical protein